MPGACSIRARPGEALVPRLDRDKETNRRETGDREDRETSRERERERECRW